MSNREALNRSNNGMVESILQEMKLGNLLSGAVVKHLRGQDADAAGAGPELATLDALVLPDHQRAASILRATVRAGGVTGELTAVAYGATPATTQIAVSPAGNLVVLATDAITDLDVVYVPEHGEVIDTVFPVASDVLTLPSSITDQKVVLLEEVEAVEGTSLGDKIVLVPGAGAPAAGQARLNIAKSTVTFAAADAVTRARVKLLVGANPNPAAFLEAVEKTI